MRITAVVVGALLAGAVQAESSGVVQWNIQKRQDGSATPRTRRLGRRASTYQETVQNLQSSGGYFATCEIGTPAQNLTLQLDTGSSDIWVPASSASVCQTSSQSDGCILGSFTSSSSSTFNDVNAGGFKISYVDGSSSKGDYFTDVFQIGGAKLTNMTMGLGLSTDISYGLVGVGYALDEASVTSVSSGVYANLPVNMVDEGLINTVAYSLWLNDLDASSGNILFGGIDTDKYKGELTRIKVYPTNGYYASFMVALTSLSAHSSSGSDSLSSSNLPLYAVLDSGTTLSYLPTDLAKQVWTEVGAEYNAKYGIALIPCSAQNSGGYFSFGFGGDGGPVINVTMDELVLDLSTGGTGAFKFTSGQYRGQDACEFGIQNYTGAPYLLGDTFLRSAYVVYDLVNNEIGIAPTDFNATTSNIVSFASASATIPSSTEAPSQDSISAGSTASPSYAAGSGFGSSSGSSQLAVVGATLCLTLLGSGVFFLL